MATDVSRTPTSRRSPVDTIRPEQLVGFGPHRIEVHSGQAVQSAGHLGGCREPVPPCSPELGYRAAVTSDHDGLAVSSRKSCGKGRASVGWGVTRRM